MDQSNKDKDADSFGDFFTYLIDLSLQHSLNRPQSPVHSETSDNDKERITTTEHTRSNELIDRGEFCIESVMESMYNYGVMHGQYMQLQVNKSNVNMHSIYGRNYGNNASSSSSLNHIHVVPSEIDELRRKSKPPPPKRGAQKKSDRKLTQEGPPVDGITPSPAATAPSSSSSSTTAAAAAPWRPSASHRHKFIGVSTTYVLDKDKVVHEVSVTVAQVKVHIGTFTRLQDAVRAHDRALIRAIGPERCNGGMLNFPLVSYKNDPEAMFSVYDNKLNEALLMKSDWTGPKPHRHEFFTFRAPLTVDKPDASPRYSSHHPPSHHPPHASTISPSNSNSNVSHTSNTTPRKKRNKGPGLSTTPPRQLLPSSSSSSSSSSPMSSVFNTKVEEQMEMMMNMNMNMGQVSQQQQRHGLLHTAPPLRHPSTNEAISGEDEPYFKSPRRHFAHATTQGPAHMLSTDHHLDYFSNGSSSNSSISNSGHRFQGDMTNTTTTSSSSSLKIGDIVVVIHGLRERAVDGRPNYERGVVLMSGDHGWVQIGFSGNFRKKLRVDVSSNPTILVPTDDTATRAMKIPLSLITENDLELLKLYQLQHTYDDFNSIITTTAPSIFSNINNLNSINNSLKPTMIVLPSDPRLNRLALRTHDLLQLQKSPDSAAAVAAAMLHPALIDPDFCCSSLSDFYHLEQTKKDSIFILQQIQQSYCSVEPCVSFEFFVELHSLINYHPSIPIFNPISIKQRHGHIYQFAHMSLKLKSISATISYIIAQEMMRYVHALDKICDDYHPIINTSSSSLSKAVVPMKASSSSSSSSSVSLEVQEEKFPALNAGGGGGGDVGAPIGDIDHHLTTLDDRMDGGMLATSTKLATTGDSNDTDSSCSVGNYRGDSHPITNECSDLDGEVVINSNAGGGGGGGGGELSSSSLLFGCNDPAMLWTYTVIPTSEDRVGALKLLRDDIHRLLSPLLLPVVLLNMKKRACRSSSESHHGHHHRCNGIEDGDDDGDAVIRSELFKYSRLLQFLCTKRLDSFCGVMEAQFPPASNNNIGVDNGANNGDAKMVKRFYVSLKSSLSSSSSSSSLEESVSQQQQLSEEMSQDNFGYFNYAIEAVIIREQLMLLEGSLDSKDSVVDCNLTHFESDQLIKLNDVFVNFIRQYCI